MLRPEAQLRAATADSFLDSDYAPQLVEIAGDLIDKASSPEDVSNKDVFNEAIDQGVGFDSKALGSLHAYKAKRIALLAHEVTQLEMAKTDLDEELRELTNG